MIVAGKTSRSSFSRYPGSVSVKVTLSGHEYFEYGNARVKLEPGHYLILNTGRPYATSIDSGTPSETISLSFDPCFARQIAADSAASDQHLLDDPQGSRVSDREIGFFEKLYPHDEHVSPIVMDIVAALKTNTQPRLWYQQQMVKLYLGMMESHKIETGKVESLKFQSKATREELFRRLMMARDFIHSNLEHDISLEDIAQVACLSLYHFLRVFKSVFGMPPNKYLTQARLDKASGLLKNPDFPISEVAVATGYSNHSAFSRAFNRRFGHSPAAFRRQFQ